jgi:hypothetical protein
MPSAVYGHCVLQIQRQKSLLLGGHPFNGNYIYNWVSRVSYHDHKLITLMTGKSVYVSGVVAWALDILIRQLDEGHWTNQNVKQARLQHQCHKQIPTLKGSGFPNKCALYFLLIPLNSNAKIRGCHGTPDTPRDDLQA